MESRQVSRARRRLGRRGHARRTAALAVFLLVAGLVSVVAGTTASASAAGSSCSATVNPVACENQKPGTPESVWDVDGAGDATIQGFSTDISVNAGNSIAFKIKTPARAYTIDIYRLGYYQGNGARFIQSVTPSASLPQTQPDCLSDPSTANFDCGNWGVSATWSVPSSAVSGVYIAKLTRTDTGGESQISFIVRNDTSTSDIVYQTSDPTWEAYNAYGGSDYYVGTTQLTSSQARAFKISYNRPFATRDLAGGRDFLFSNEYPTIRFLERNGYDVSYISGVDTDRYGATQLTQHKVFLSVGHDEYWSQAQRTNVENARNAGVSLMFLSGNEVYWHTRYEPSTDGTNTPYRTLVCYKETWDNAPTDPTGESTATWRDPRFGPSPGGGNPENGLTGTLYQSNFTDLPIQVSGAEGKMRLWRNTTLGSVPDTTVTSLAPHTVGYESDEDRDNGFRPAGLVDLSTTVGAAPQLLTDFGNNVVSGTTTHHVTLYKAASGALVFGAGTIQWGWGLDSDHDGTESPADSRMQQATANMLADMQALPTTLMTGLTMPTPSTDTTAPTAVITSPAAGAALANGTQITVTGTASDVGGQVAGVEVSLDAGATWHPAKGRSSWSYTGVLAGNGTSSILARATDDSANRQQTPTSVGVTVACPCSMFGPVTPAMPSSGDNHDIQVGVRFTADVDGFVTGVRFYKGTGNTGSHTGTLWTAGGSVLATGVFTNETASGWQTLQFATPVAVSRNTTYVASYYAPNGNYSADANYFAYRGVDAIPLHTPGGLNQANGVYQYGTGFPNQSYQSTNYYVSPVFMPSGTLRPIVVSTSPNDGATGANAAAAITATFSTQIDSASLVFTLKDAANAAVSGNVTYDSASHTATFTPSAPLNAGSSYVGNVNASDTSGLAMLNPYSFGFSTGSSGVCPCSIFPSSSVPASTATNDNSSVEVGVKFSSDSTGVITGVKFYKAATNTGTHTGSLWSASGKLLATGTFTNETASGWQTLTFTSPVPVTAGATYIASYHAPNGNYSINANAFATSGVENPPLHVPAGGAVYSYDTGAPSNSSNSNYWVDVTFALTSSVVPSVVSTTPDSSATGVDPGAAITATMSTPISSGSATMTVTGPSGAVSGAVAYNAGTQVLAFTPSAALANGTTYTVSVSGATTPAGKTMAAAYTWSFTTQAVFTCPCGLFAAGATPAVIDSGDASAVNLGVRFSSVVNGSVTGVRFYKAVANTGTHTASLWTAGGTRLATATFSNETASGWQSVSFSAPVAITAGTTYIVSYYAPSGDYSVDSHFFDNALSNGPLAAPAGNNGVYAYGVDGFPSSTYGNANYWVDPIVSTATVADTTPPSVESVTPPNTAVSVNTAVVPTARFSEPVNATTIQFQVKDSNNAVAAGTVSYNAATQTASFAPAAALARGMTYTASVSASDVAGNAMTAPATYSFTTMQPDPAVGACPCTVWPDSNVPTVIASSDSSAVELGTKFTADSSGTITGIRYYKAATNTGVHKVTLWTSAGSVVATATAANEPASGWVTVTFPTPASIVAGTTYLASYSTTVGNYSATPGALATTGIDNGPLHVPAHGSAYVYGAGFPTSSSDTTYAVTPVFVPPADTTPPVVSSVTAAPGLTGATVTWTTDEASSSQVIYGTSATSLTSTANGANSVTAHSVTLSGLPSATVYFYRVVSADASANTATSPTASAAAASFTTASPDTTPPVVATPSASITTTTANISWTTDEPSTTRVDYGTSATNLNLNASVAGLSTTHAVTFTVAANTRYYYRVTSVDASGNSTTSPATTSAAASVAPTVSSLIDTTAADFTAGTRTNSTVSDFGTDAPTAGEVVSTPTVSADFGGTTLPTAFKSTAVVTGGTSAVAGGVVTVQGSTLTTTATYTSGKFVESQVVLLPGHSFGWVSSTDNTVKATFSVNSSNQLIATENDGLFNSASSVVATGWTAVAHKLRIEWTSTAVTFYVDDVQKYTNSYFPLLNPNQRPFFTDPVRTDAGLSLDYTRIGVFASSATFVSRVFDASAPVSLDAMTWDASVPAGTTMTVQVRTATVSGSWSAWTTIPASGTSVNKTARFFQYQVLFTTTGNHFVTPTLRSVQVAAHV